MLVTIEASSVNGIDTQRFLMLIVLQSHTFVEENPRASAITLEISSEEMAPALGRNVTWLGL